MPPRQRNNQLTMTDRGVIRRQDQPGIRLTAERRDGTLDIGSIADKGMDRLHSNRSGNGLNCGEVATPCRGMSLHDSDALQLRCDVLEQLQKLGIERGLEQKKAGDVAAWPRVTLRESGTDRIAGLDRHDRCGVRLLMHSRDREVWAGDKDIRCLSQKFHRDGARAIRTSMRPANIKVHVAALCPPELTE